MQRNVIISALWKHSNIEIQLGDDWEWSDDPDQDLYDAWNGWNSISTPDILNDIEFPTNWTKAGSVKSLFYPELDTIDQMDFLVTPTPEWQKIAASLPSWFGTLIIPSGEDPSSWAEKSSDEKLEAIGDYESSGINYQVYFDFYVCGVVTFALQIDEKEDVDPIETAKDQLDKFLEQDFRLRLEKALPTMDGDPNLDESIEIIAAPHWVMISAS